jgi:ankyrin repeat protein
VTLLLARFGDEVGGQLGMGNNNGYSVAHFACGHNRSSTLALLLDAGAPMDAHSDHGATPLMLGAARGATDCVTLLLARFGDGVGEQLGMVDGEVDSAAHLACCFNQPSALALLLDAGASTTAPEGRGLTPLMVAAEQGAIDCVTLLLARFGDEVGEQLRMVDNEGDTAAHIACYYNERSTLALLLDAGASMTARNNH